MDDYLSTSKFTILNDGARTPNIRVFEADATPLEQESLGRLFLISELKSDNPNVDEILSFLEEEIKRNYYGTDSFDAERAFEMSLQRTNHQLHDLLKKSGSDWLEDLNCIVAIIYGDQLHLAHLGRMHAYLVHGDKIVDILDAAGSHAAPKINPLRIFSNIVSGVVSPHDTLMFGNTNILDYLSLEKIRKTIVDHKPESVAEYLKNLLEETGSPNNFGALFIHIDRIPAKSSKPLPRQQEIISTEQQRKDAAPEASMNILTNKEEETVHLLQPSVIHHVKSVINRLRNKNAGASRDTSGGPLSRRIARKQQNRNIHKPETWGLKIWRGIIIIMQNIGKIGIAFAGAITKRRKYERVRRPIHRGTISARAKNGVQSWFNRFLRLPRSRKALLIISMLFIFFFAQSVIRSGESKDKQLSQEEYERLISEAEENVVEAENVLIYENEDDARTFLVSALDNIAQIPEDNDDYADRIFGIRKKAEKLLQQVNHVTLIDNPEKIADISTAFPDVKTAGLLKMNGKLFVYHPSDQTIYQVGLPDGDILDIATAAETGIKYGVPQNGTALLLEVDRSLLQLDPGNAKTQRRDLAFSQDSPSVDAVAYFGNRLYTLDAGNRQIYKHTAGENGFGAGTPWLTSDNANLQNARDMAIDGSVYILSNDGSIAKYFQGALDNTFASPTLSPQTNDAIRLITNDVMENMYVLDKAQNRLLVLSKEGALLSQITSPKFDNLKDMAIDEPAGAAYILSGTTIYKVPLA